MLHIATLSWKAAFSTVTINNTISKQDAGGWGQDDLVSNKKKESGGEREERAWLSCRNAGGGGSRGSDEYSPEQRESVQMFLHWQHQLLFIYTHATLF